MRRGEIIKSYIIDNVDRKSIGFAKVVSKKFKISRQASNKYIRFLVNEGLLTSEGATKNIRYSLSVLDRVRFSYMLDDTVEEHVIWNEYIEQYFDDLPREVSDIWHYGFTEMLNNAIDHSAGTEVIIELEKTAAGMSMAIDDNGVGIFKKIMKEMSLSDESHAVLELSKGKLTTDPKNHSGQGIFFASRMFDQFAIISGGVHFSHYVFHDGDWIWSRKDDGEGTYVWMQINNSSKRTMLKVFDQFSLKGSYGFDKTVVPVELAKTSEENLVSRSQAKRVLARIDKFDEVIFDFKNIDMIGQAFADEVFRVFKNRHPDIEIRYENTNKKVLGMISRALQS